VENGGLLRERRHGATPYHIRFSFANGRLATCIYEMDSPGARPS
jgi:hypothetical protein